MIPNYDYIVKAVDSLYESKNSAYPTYSDNTAQDALKKELNKAFPDFKCLDVKYTDNFDKEFFGIFVYPCGASPAEFIDKTFAGLTSLDTEFEPFKFPSYVIELDGKLFRDFHFSYAELTALIIQEICSMNSTDPFTRLRNAIDYYICDNNIHIEMDIVNRWAPMFELAGKITLHNITSLFTRFEFSPIDNMSDIVRDGLTEPFMSAWNKLNTSGRMEEVNTNMVMLGWYFSRYRDFENSRQTDYLLRNAMKTEASSIIKQMTYNAIKAIDGYVISNDNRYYRDTIQESTKRKGLIYQMKRNGLKSIEEDLYEYNMRLRNVETQDEAILLMRQINSRMSILEEYLEEEDMDEKDRKRWESCYKKYLELREALSKKTVYNRKMYGLFVDYNALQQMNDNGNFMNTYY